MGDILMLIAVIGIPYYFVHLIVSISTRWQIEKALTGLALSIAALFAGFCITVVDSADPESALIAKVLVLVIVGTLLYMKYKDKCTEALSSVSDGWSKAKRKLGIKGFPQIVEVKYLGTVVTDSRRGGFAGALLGGWLYGETGAAIGGMMPTGSKTLCRFAVRYDNGKVKIVDCHKTDPRYKEFMSYVRWEDL